MHMIGHDGEHMYPNVAMMARNGEPVLPGELAVRIQMHASIPYLTEPAMPLFGVEGDEVQSR